MNGGREDRKADRCEKALIVLLRATAILLLTAVAPAVMPYAWMQAIHRQLGMGDLPAGPIMGYLTRSLSAMYAVHGALVFFVSLDVRRFLPVVKCLGVLGIVFGIAMTVLDILVGMPWFWIAGEGPWIALLGAVVLGLARRVNEMDPPRGRV